MKADAAGLLAMVALDRASPVPLYHQLFLQIHRLIKEGHVMPGDALPQTAELCQALGVSTITATRAMGELKREGLISPCRGRGTFVAERKNPTTELILFTHIPAPPLSRNVLSQLLLVGLRQGFANPRRRCVVTQYDREAPTAGELKAMMRLRQADSLVFHRPDPALLPALRAIAEDYPTVGILSRIADGVGDCVLPAPCVPLRKILRTHVREGARALVYAGKANLRRSGTESPYERLWQAFDAFAAVAGMKPVVHFLEAPTAAAESEPTTAQQDEMLAERIGALPPNAVVVADTPHIAAQIRRRNPTAKPISYTEFFGSVAEFQGEMTLLYVGWDRAAAEAARVLERRLAEPGRPVEEAEVVPQVFAAGGEDAAVLGSGIGMFGMA